LPQSGYSRNFPVPIAGTGEKRRRIAFEAFPFGDPIMSRCAALLALCIGLAACAGPTEVASTPPGISYRVAGDNIADANLRADTYCQRYNRRAVLDGINQSGSDRIAAYSCR
jgi:hypothetical protein